MVLLDMLFMVLLLAVYHSCISIKIRIVKQSYIVHHRANICIATSIKYQLVFYTVPICSEVISRQVDFFYHTVCVSNSSHKLPSSCNCSVCSVWSYIDFYASWTVSKLVQFVSYVHLDVLFPSSYWSTCPYSVYKYALFCCVSVIPVLQVVSYLYVISTSGVIYVQIVSKYCPSSCCPVTSQCPVLIDNKLSKFVDTKCPYSISSRYIHNSSLYWEWLLV